MQEVIVKVYTFSELSDNSKTKALENSYESEREWHTSDDYIIEMFANNEYLFTADGQDFKYGGGVDE